MELLIVRHGIAVEPGTPGMTDEDRPLTKEGEQRFAEVARALARLLPAPDILLTSPLLRARATAEIAARAWGGPSPTVAAELAGGMTPRVLALVKAYSDHSLVALFGHEPGVSLLLAHLVGTKAADRLAFKKGAAALLDLPDGDVRQGRLLWFLPPRLVRELIA